MDIREIERKSLVVAIWDKDSKSNDDFMAGVCLALRMKRFKTLSIGQSGTPRCKNL